MWWFILYEEKQYLDIHLNKLQFLKITIFGLYSLKDWHILSLLCIDGRLWRQCFCGCWSKMLYSAKRGSRVFNEHAQIRIDCRYSLFLIIDACEEGWHSSVYRRHFLIPPHDTIWMFLTSNWFWSILVCTIDFFLTDCFVEHKCLYRYYIFSMNANDERSHYSV